MLELPQYRWPTVRSLGLRLYDRSAALPEEGRHDHSGRELCAVGAQHPASAQRELFRPGSSVIGKLGHFVEPVLRPLGFNWKIGIGLLSSIIAREVIVGTLGTLYGVDPNTRRWACRRPCGTI